MKAVWILAAYLLGAVPFGLLLARMKGVDIRKVGSGNIGATNVMRSIGKSWGIATFVLDALKGLLPVLLFPGFAGTSHEGFRIGCAFAAILGHNFPVWLGFKGGKGVATSAGALFGLAPAAAGIGLVAWFAFFYSTRFVSVASMGSAAAIAISGWLLYLKAGWLLPGFLTVIALLVIFRHKANIIRLCNGTENKFGKKKTTEGTEVH